MWKEIPNTDGLYFANEKGEIKSTSRERYYNAKGIKGCYKRNGKILKQPINNHGYPCVTIKYRNGSQKVIQVHQLIARTFLPNPENKPQINHIDGNKQNNNVSNLEWCTASENLKHAFRTGLNKGSRPFKGKFGKEHFGSKPVIAYNKDGTIYKEYESQCLAAKDLGVNSSHISQCVNGKRNTAYGYLWKSKLSP